MKHTFYALLALALCTVLLPLQASAVSEKEAEVLAQAFCNPGYENAQKLDSEVRTIYLPTENASYAHHAHIACFQGRLYATFSLGRENEDDCGQRIMISTSEDMGDTWSTPVPLQDTIMGNHSQRVLVNGGLYTDGKRLNAYFGGYEYQRTALRGENLRPLEDAYRSDYRMYIMTTTDGVNWSEPKISSCAYIPARGPQKTQNGTLLMSAGSALFLTDDPEGLSGFRTRKVYTDHANDCGVNQLTEGAFIQLDDGTLCMLLRTDTDRMWCAFSNEKGNFWTQAYQTNMTDCRSKFQFHRLEDGRYIYIGGPVPRSARTPLMLSVSQDGFCYDQHYILRDEPYTQLYDGMYKGGVYAYPELVVAEDTLYVIYSKHKEAIEVTYFPLSALHAE